MQPHVCSSTYVWLYLYITQPRLLILLHIRASGKFKPGTDSSYVLPWGSDLGTLTGLYFYWEFDADWYKPWEWSLFDNPDVYVTRIEVDSMETGD